MRDDVAGPGKTILVQPRRLAARGAASRLASLVGCKLGDQIGYQVRFDRRSSQRTKVLAVTTGILLRKLTSDPLLDDVTCVILDEFHERSLEMDLALGMLQRIRTSLRPELKLVVMSATLDPQPIVDFLGHASAVTSEGRAFPVKIHHHSQISRDPIDQQVTEVMPRVLSATSGHVLVFLPGVGEIRRTKQALIRNGFGSDAAVMELFGDLSPKDQDTVIAPCEQRKIILATNVAETSVTIPGVTAVIDSGQARVMQFDPNVGMPALRMQPISQASAEQRAGRAGRTEPGVCWRLWPANAHRSRPIRDKPEIERNDFCGSMLMMAAWGEREPKDFPWLTPPTEDAILAAETLLQRLDAIDQDRGVTEIGQQMLRLPLHPRISRFMVAAAETGVANRAAIAAALLTERDPFRVTHHRGSNRANQGKPPRQANANVQSDVLDRVERMEAFQEGHRESVTNVAAAKHVLRVSKQLQKSVDESAGESDDEDSDTNLLRALLAAYPDRLARRRQPDSDRGVMVGGRGVKLDRGSLVKSETLFLCVDVDAKASEALVRAASAVDQDWLDPRLMREVDEPFFHPSMKAVVARRRLYFQDLLLEESPIECKPGAEVGKILFQHAKSKLDQLMPDDGAVNEWIGRVRFLATHLPGLELPALDVAAIEDLLRQLCESCTTFQQLRAANWLDHLRGQFDYEQLQLVERLAPSKLQVPSGNQVRVRYTAGKPPIMEVRVQELFGWKETPRVARGKVAVQLHLLGPNRRPQQITEDLANFWKETYIQVRKDLRRRYPKHHWPEDPITAKATRNGLKPRD